MSSIVFALLFCLAIAPWSSFNGAKAMENEDVNLDLEQSDDWDMSAEINGTDTETPSTEPDITTPDPKTTATTKATTGKPTSESTVTSSITTESSNASKSVSYSYAILVTFVVLCLQAMSYN